MTGLAVHLADIPPPAPVCHTRPVPTPGKLLLNSSPAGAYEAELAKFIRLRTMRVEADVMLVSDEVGARPQ